MTVTPFRSALYVPGSNARALEKAASLDVDTILFDLEDAVAPSAKIAGREALAQVLRTVDFGHRQRIVRINDLSSDWGQGDVDALRNCLCDGILLPKVRSASPT